MSRPSISPHQSPWLPWLRGLSATAALGAATYGYASWESRQFTLREHTLPVLPAGAPEVRVLHLSDIHLIPGQHKKRQWLAQLADLGPDLVINTGDNLAHRDAVGPVLDALRDLLELPGVFVFGSNDYYSPTFRNPLRYLGPNKKRFTDTPQLPWRELRDEFIAAGWINLTNTYASLEVAGVRLAFAGVDDPHLRYDNLARVAQPGDPSADVRLAVAHAPYLRVLDHFSALGYEAIIAGHTHGGQVCVPGVGALVTNCDLDRGRASGLHRHPKESRPGDPDSSWLHVSAGLGTNPYTRVRVACRPEATLLTLTSAA